MAVLSSWGFWNVWNDDTVNSIWSGINGTQGNETITLAARPMGGWSVLDLMEGHDTLELTFLGLDGNQDSASPLYYNVETATDWTLHIENVERIVAEESVITDTNPWSHVDLYLTSGMNSFSTDGSIRSIYGTGGEQHISWDSGVHQNLYATNYNGYRYTTFAAQQSIAMSDHRNSAQQANNDIQRGGQRDFEEDFIIVDLGAGDDSVVLNGHHLTVDDRYWVNTFLWWGYYQYDQYMVPEWSLYYADWDNQQYLHAYNNFKDYTIQFRNVEEIRVDYAPTLGPGWGGNSTSPGVYTPADPRSGYTPPNVDPADRGFGDPIFDPHGGTPPTGPYAPGYVPPSTDPTDPDYGFGDPYNTDPIPYHPTTGETQNPDGSTPVPASGTLADPIVVLPRSVSGATSALSSGYVLGISAPTDNAEGQYFLREIDNIPGIDIDSNTPGNQDRIRLSGDNDALSSSDAATALVGSGFKQINLEAQNNITYAQIQYQIFTEAGLSDEIIVLGTNSSEAIISVQSAGQIGLYGFDGNDIIDGSASNEIILGGNHNDILLGNGGFDYIDGETGSDELHGGAGENTLLGGDGADVIYANYTNSAGDVVFGGAGNDTIYAFAGDVVDGGAGNDVLEADVVIGNSTISAEALDITGRTIFTDNDGSNSIYTNGGDAVYFGAPLSSGQSSVSGLNNIPRADYVNTVLNAPSENVTLLLEFGATSRSLALESADASNNAENQSASSTYFYVSDASRYQLNLTAVANNQNDLINVYGGDIYDTGYIDRTREVLWWEFHRDRGYSTIKGQNDDGSVRTVSWNNPFANLSSLDALSDWLSDGEKFYGRTNGLFAPGDPDFGRFWDAVRTDTSSIKVASNWSGYLTFYENWSNKTFVWYVRDTGDGVISLDVPSSEMIYIGVLNGRAGNVVEYAALLDGSVSEQDVSGQEQTPPPLPVPLQLAAEDDTGESSADGLTLQTSDLTLTGFVDAAMTGGELYRWYDAIDLNGDGDTDDVLTSLDGIKESVANADFDLDGVIEDAVTVSNISQVSEIMYGIDFDRDGYLEADLRNVGSISEAAAVQNVVFEWVDLNSNGAFDLDEITGAISLIVDANSNLQMDAGDIVGVNNEVKLELGSSATSIYNENGLNLTSISLDLMDKASEDFHRYVFAQSTGVGGSRVYSEISADIAATVQIDIINPGLQLSVSGNATTLTGTVTETSSVGLYVADNVLSSDADSDPDLLEQGSVTVNVGAAAGSHDFNLQARSTVYDAWMRAEDLAGNIDTTVNSQRIVLGTNSADTIVASNVPSMIYGFDGDDQIEGGSGSDKIYADSLIATQAEEFTVDLQAGTSGVASLTFDLPRTSTPAATPVVVSITDASNVDGSGVEIAAAFDTSSDWDVTYDSASNRLTFVQKGATEGDVPDVSEANIVDVSVASGESSGLIGGVEVTQQGVLGSTDGYNDTIVASAGDDTVDGGAGEDTYQMTVGVFGDLNLNSVSAQPQGGANSVTVVNIENIDASSATASLTLTGLASASSFIEGGSGNDSIVGGNAVDTFYGGAGNDTMSSGFGNDDLYGGSGDDVFEFRVDSNDLALTQLDLVDGGDNNDTIEIQLNGLDDPNILDQDFANVREVENLEVTGSAGVAGVTFDVTSTNLVDLSSTHFENSGIRNLDFANVTGSGQMITVNLGGLLVEGENYFDQNIIIRGSLTQANNIIGGTGNDTITSGEVNDTISGGDGDDVLDGGAGVDVLTGDGGADAFMFANVLDAPVLSINLAGSDADAIATIDTISDYEIEADVLNFGTTPIITSGGSAVAGTSVNVSSSGFVTFAGGDDTLVERISVLQTDPGLNGTANSVALFSHGEDAYVFYTGTTADVGDNQLVRLEGMSALDTMEITGDNIAVLRSPTYDWPIAVSMSYVPTPVTTGAPEENAPSASSGMVLASQTPQQLYVPSGGFGTQEGSGDDYFRTVDISSVFPNGLNFFNANGTPFYTQAYMGSNGYITFAQGYRGYVPSGVASFTYAPMIAAQFDDLYVVPGRNVTRGSGNADDGGLSGGSGYMYSKVESDKVVFTWDNVGLFSSNRGGYSSNNVLDKVGSALQVILHRIDDGTTGNFGIEIRYEDINIQYNTANAGWTAGDQFNYGLVGDGIDGFELEDAYATSNVGIDGVWAWNVEGGRVQAPPAEGLYLPSVDPAGGTDMSVVNVVAEVSVQSGGPLGDSFTPDLVDDDGGRFTARLKSGTTNVFEIQNVAGARWNIWKEDYKDLLTEISIGANANPGPGSYTATTVEFTLYEGTDDPVVRGTTDSGGDGRVDHDETSTTLTVYGTSSDLNTASEGDLTTITAINMAPAAAGVDLSLGNQSEGFTVTGSGHGDTIVGSGGNDTINGGTGPDILTGGAGNDTFAINGPGTYITTITDLGVGADKAMLNTGGGGAVSATLGADFTADNDTWNRSGDASKFTINTAGYDLDLDLTATYPTIGAGFTIIVDTGDSTVTGSDYADSITGGSLADSLTGGAGNDTISGGGGADTLTGGIGNDVYVYSTTTDVAAAESIVESASGGTDQIRVEGNTDFSAMAALNFDEIEQVNITGAFTATFTGVQLSGEAISLLGDVGTQTLRVDQASAGSTIDLSQISAGANWTSGEDRVEIWTQVGVTNDTIYGSQTDDLIIAREGNDSVIAGAGNDEIYGDAGNDYLVGGSGVDTVAGGDGDDIIEMMVSVGDIDSIWAQRLSNPAADEIHGDTLVLTGTAAGTVTVNLSISNAQDQFTDGVDTLVQSGFEHVDASQMLGAGMIATARAAGSEIIGSEQNDTLNGGAGADTIVAGAGDDSITGGAGADSIEGEGGDDRLVADDADVLVDGGTGADTMALALDATFLGAELANVETIELASGAEVTVDYTDVTGADNVSTVTGVSDGNVEKLIVVGAASGTVTLDYSTGLTLTDVLLEVQGGAADEAITGTAGDDTIDGGAGADVINGGDGDDVIDGGADADSLVGGSGNDRLIFSTPAGATAAADTLVGEAGNDVYVFSGTGYYDGTARLIVEQAGEGTADRLYLDNVNFGQNFLDSNFDNIEQIEVAGPSAATFRSSHLTGRAIELFGGDALINQIYIWVTGSTDLSNFTLNSSWETQDYVTINGLNSNVTQDTIIGSSANDVIDGRLGDDSISGGSGDDTITGGTGADSIEGQGGDDRLVADDADVLVDGGTGADTMALALDATFLGAELANVETIELASGAEVTVDYTDVTGADNVSTVTGVSDGNVEKLIVVGAASGTVTLDYSTGLTLTDVLLEVQGGAADEVITGTAGDDTIDGGAGADSLNGGDGNDTLIYDNTNNVGGADTLIGGDGNDVYEFVNNTFSGRTIGASVEIREIGGEGTDRLYVGGASSLIFNDVAASSFDEIEEIEVAVGQVEFAGAQLTGKTMTLFGVDGAANQLRVKVTDGGITDLSNFVQSANWLAGEDSIQLYAVNSTNDTIIGSSGDDNISGSSGDDSITAGDGADTIKGGSGSDDIILTESISAVDTINVGTSSTSDSARIVVAGANNDVGADTITGFTWGTDGITVTIQLSSNFTHGDNTAIGLGAGTEDGSANDFAASTGLISTNGDADFVDGSDLALTFVASSTTMTEALFEDALTYNIFGTTGDDTFTTGAGADTVRGDAGNDIITGGAGADAVTGGAGADTFVFGSSATHLVNYTGADSDTSNIDSITDFVVADDTIQISDGVTFANLLMAAGTTSATVTYGTAAIDAGADITALTSAMQTDTAGTASTAAANGLQVYVFETLAGTDGLDGKTFLVINDDAAAIDANDVIIEITGVTGTLTSADFVIA